MSHAKELENRKFHKRCTKKGEGGDSFVRTPANDISTRYKDSSHT